jgi:hypothetical protein
MFYEQPATVDVGLLVLQPTVTYENHRNLLKLYSFLFARCSDKQQKKQNRLAVINRSVSTECTRVL